MDYKITDIKITNMSDVDGSDDVRYWASINDGEYNVYCQTDGVFNPHMTIDEFRNKVHDYFERNTNTIVRDEKKTQA